MTVYVSLLRGVNVGGKNKLPMKDLVVVLEKLGLRGVETYIQSGNVVFESRPLKESTLESRIQDAIENEFGFGPDVCVRDADALNQAVAGNPFPKADADPTAVHLTFLAKVPKDVDTEALAALAGPKEKYVLDGRVFYLFAPDGYHKSKLATKLERTLGVSATSRNWRTVRKLQEMIASRK